MFPYTERSKHQGAKLSLLIRHLAKLGAKYWFFALSCKGLRSRAGFGVLLQRIAVPCKPVHSSSDHSTLNEVKVLWRDRPF